MLEEEVKHVEVRMSTGNPSEGLEHATRPQKHVYTTLNRDTRETRLVRIDHEGTRATDVVHLDVKIVELDKHVPFDARHWESNDASACPAYNALSYTWEPKLPQHVIYINEAPRMIGHNLYQFLSRLSRPSGHIRSRTPWWWIDALSIDQDNDAEKNHQLPLMRDIYAQCDFLFAWLGDCRAINRSLQALATEWLPTENTMAAVLRAPYFRRLWVVQELLLPSIGDPACERTWLSCGSVTTNAKGFFQEANWYWPEFQDLNNSSTLHLLRKRYKLSVDSFDEEEQSWYTRPPNPRLQKEKLIMSLFEAISVWSVKECSDPRDRVAGLLGLVKPQEAPVIRYTDSVLSAYLETMLVLMNSDSWERNVAPVYLKAMKDDTQLHPRDRLFAFSTRLDGLVHFMGLKSILGKDHCDFLDALSEQAERNWRLRLGSLSRSALNSRWLEALMYCHQCHRILFRTRGIWYDCFKILVALQPQKIYRLYGRIPVSGSRAHLPVREIVLSPELEKEREYHINLLKTWPCAKTQATVVEDTASLLLSYT